MIPETGMTVCTFRRANAMVCPAGKPMAIERLAVEYRMTMD